VHYSNAQLVSGAPRPATPGSAPASRPDGGSATTGTGSRGEANDLAVVWPPERAPLLISVYTVPDDPAAKPDERVLADAASIVAKALVPTS
jgi:beta-lactamase class A